jgi:hypothetical protein
MSSSFAPLVRTLALSGYSRISGAILVDSAGRDQFLSLVPLCVVLSEHTLHLPSFDIRPNELFEGVTQRLCFVFSGDGDGRQTWSAGYRRWLAPERPALLATERYATIDGRRDVSESLPKFSLDIEKSIRAKLGSGSLAMLVDAPPSRSTSTASSATSSRRSTSSRCSSMPRAIAAAARITRSLISDDLS